MMNFIAFILVFLMPLFQLIQLIYKRNGLDKFSEVLKLNAKARQFGEDIENEKLTKKILKLIAISSLLFVFFYGLLPCELPVGRRYPGYIYLSFTFVETLWWAIGINVVAWLGYYFGDK